MLGRSSLILLGCNLFAPFCRTDSRSWQVVEADRILFRRPSVNLPNKLRMSSFCPARLKNRVPQTAPGAAWERCLLSGDMAVVLRR